MSRLARGGSLLLGDVVTDDEPKEWCEELFGADWRDLDAQAVFDVLAERLRTTLPLQ